MYYDEGGFSLFPLRSCMNFSKAVNFSIEILRIFESVFVEEASFRWATFGDGGEDD